MSRVKRPIPLIMLTGFRQPQRMRPPTHKLMPFVPPLKLAKSGLRMTLPLVPLLILAKNGLRVTGLTRCRTPSRGACAHDWPKATQ